MKILIADDSMLFRAGLKRILSNIQGIRQIIEADSYVSTINQLEEHYPDILILDIRLPDESGFHVLDFIKDLKQKPLVIIASDYATKNNRDKAIEKGARYVFDKSHEYTKILKVVREYKPKVSF